MRTLFGLTLTSTFYTKGCVEAVLDLGQPFELQNYRINIVVRTLLILDLLGGSTLNIVRVDL